MYFHNVFALDGEWEYNVLHIYIYTVLYFGPTASSLIKHDHIHFYNFSYMLCTVIMVQNVIGNFDYELSISKLVESSEYICTLKCPANLVDFRFVGI